MKTQNASFVRASISFAPDIYQSLEDLAKRKKVSLAWVVREAAERYVSEETAEGADGKRRTLRAAGTLTRSTRR
jgi:predicted transcriptional regulator